MKPLSILQLGNAISDIDGQLQSKRENFTLPELQRVKANLLSILGIKEKDLGNPAVIKRNGQELSRESKAFEGRCEEARTIVLKCLAAWSDALVEHRGRREKLECHPRKGLAASMRRYLGVLQNLLSNEETMHELQPYALNILNALFEIAKKLHQEELPLMATDDAPGEIASAVKGEVKTLEANASDLVLNFDGSGLDYGYPRDSQRIRSGSERIPTRGETLNVRRHGRKHSAKVLVLN